KGGDAGAAAGQDHGGHAVAAAVVEHVQAGHVAEPGEGRTNPGLVIEVSVVADEHGVGIGPEGGRPPAGLLLVGSRLAVHLAFLAWLPTRRYWVDGGGGMGGPAPTSNRPVSDRSALVFWERPLAGHRRPGLAPRRRPGRARKNGRPEHSQCPDRPEHRQPGR